MADLSVTCFGLRFPNPILTGAGPQTDTAQDLQAALDWGAGGLVTRTVTAEPVPPPPLPSTVEYGKDGLISIDGYSLRYAEEWLTGLYPKVAGASRARAVPLIASLSGPPDDVRYLGPDMVSAGAQALEYNTAFMDWAESVAALQALRQGVSVPVIAKLGLFQGEDIAERAAAVEPFVDGFTCMARFGPVLDIDVDGGGKPRLGGPDGFGWLSGAPIHPIAVRTVFAVANRVKKPVIASGGVMTTRDVVEFLQAGACLVQVCTGAILKGPALYGKLAQGLAAWLDERGMAGVADIQDAYRAKYGHGQRVITEQEEAPTLSEARCIRCGICGDVCYYDAIAAPRKQLPVITDAACFQCGLCVSACPTEALAFRAREAVTRLPKL